MFLPRKRESLITYRGPNGIVASDQYRVRIRQGRETQEAFVYKANATWRTNRCKDTSWANFSFLGPVEVIVEKLTGTFPPCRLLPGSRKIRPVVRGNTLTFTIDRPGQFALDFGKDITHPLLIFADPLETDIPKPSDPDVLYFGPGIHDIGPDFDVSQKRIVYLAGGAYVRGTLTAKDTKGLRICGRGILSGEKFDKPGGPHLIHLKGWDSKDALIEGITLINAPSYNITTDGNGHTARNVKMIGWWFRTDGVQMGTNSLTEDCFFKVNDDSLKLYHSGTRVRRCTIWQMENGAPFQISWNMPSDNSGFHVSDCDIIRCEHEWNNDNEAIFCAIHGGKGHMSDYVFENIRIENADWRLVSLQIKPNEFAQGQTPGTVSMIVFRNITVAGAMKKPNVLRGLSLTQKVRDVLFENVRVEGRLLRGPGDMPFEIDSMTTENIQFQVPPNAGA